MIKEPYIRIKTLDFSALGDSVPDSLNVGMVINSDTGPTAITKISNVTQLIKYYSTKQQLTLGDDTTLKHAAKLLQSTPLYLTRAFDNSVLAGKTNRGDTIYTDLQYNHLPYSTKVVVKFKNGLSADFTSNFTSNNTNGVKILNGSTVKSMIFNGIRALSSRGSTYGLDTYSEPIPAGVNSINLSAIPPDKDPNYLFCSVKSPAGADSISAVTYHYSSTTNTITVQLSGTPTVEGYTITYAYYKDNAGVVTIGSNQRLGQIDVPNGADHVTINVESGRLFDKFIGGTVKVPSASSDDISLTTYSINNAHTSITIQLSASAPTAGYKLDYLVELAPSGTQIDPDPTGTSTVSDQPFIIDVQGDYFRVVGDSKLKVDNFNYGQTVNSYDNENWKLIKFNYRSGESDDSPLNHVDVSSYICLNGYTFFPSYETGATDTIYPNIAVPLNFPGSTAPTVAEFKVALLDRLISGEYGISEAYTFTNGVSVSGNYSVDNDYNYGSDYFEARNNEFIVWPNSINYNELSSGTGLVLKCSKTENGETSTNVYTLPYNKDYELGTGETLIEETKGICSLYGLINLITQIENVSININDKENSAIYIKDSDLVSYSTNNYRFFGKTADRSSNIISSLIPTEESLGLSDTIGSCWIRIGDYVFYNINISSKNIRNNPDLELVKLSTVELTYKQFLSKLRREVGNVFNTINTENGFTLYWRVDPNATEFGYSKDTLKMWFNADDTKDSEEGIGDGGDKVTLTLDDQGHITGGTVVPGNGLGYTVPPKLTVIGDGIRGEVVPVMANKHISSIQVKNKGQNYNTVSCKVEPQIPIKNSSAVASDNGFAVVARFPSKQPILQYSFIRQDIEVDDGDPELYTLSLKYKGENVGDYTISFVENKIDGYNRSVYYNWVNDVQDFVQLIKLNGTVTQKEFESQEFGDEVIVVDPEVDDYMAASDRFLVKDGTYYDIMFDGGYVNAAYAKHLVDISAPDADGENGLWAQAFLTCVDDKDWQDLVAYRDATAINNHHGWMSAGFVQDSTVADFLCDISESALAIEKIFANRTGGREFAVIFGPANGSMVYKPKHPIEDKDIREKLLNKQINVLTYDKSLGVSYFNLDLTMQTQDSSLSDCNNVRTMNCMSHIADNYLKWFWGRVNDTATRAEVTSGITSRINERCVNNQIYHIDEFLVVCNASNNPDTVIENRQLVVDIKAKYRNAIRYINVFHKVYRLTQSFDAAG